MNAKGFVVVLVESHLSDCECSNQLVVVQTEKRAFHSSFQILDTSETRYYQ